jgi:hypothetical protein
VAEENLGVRRKRPARELTRDSVERALNEQVELSLSRSPFPSRSLSLSLSLSLSCALS